MSLGVRNTTSGWCRVCRVFIYRGRGVWWRGNVYCHECHLDAWRCG
jgi:hypothetical protein